MNFFNLDKRKRAFKADISNMTDEFFMKNRVVALKRLRGKRVSTVFLGLDHALRSNEKPLIFETMVFCGEDYMEIYMDRYTTHKQAQKGHRQAIKWVLGGCIHEPRQSKTIYNKQKSMKIFINK